MRSSSSAAILNDIQYPRYRMALKMRKLQSTFMSEWRLHASFCANGHRLRFPCCISVCSRASGRRCIARNSARHGGPAVGSRSRNHQSAAIQRSRSHLPVSATHPSPEPSGVPAGGSQSLFELASERFRRVRHGFRKLENRMQDSHACVACSWLNAFALNVHAAGTW